MRGVARLSTSLAVSLAAVALIGLSIVDVVFVFWAQRELLRERRAEAWMVAVAGLDALAEDPSAAALQGVERNDFTLTAIDHGGRRVSTERLGAGDAVPDLPADATLPRWLAQGNMEHLVVGARGTPYARFVVSRRLDDILPRLYAVHERALVLLGAAAVIMVGLGLVFMRRTVLQPLRRLTESVGRGDRAALLEWAPSPDDGVDGIGQLGHAIIAMTHAIEEDRERIARQLAELEATQSQLVRAERLAVVGQLAAGVAHEIGNPLAVLAGFVEMLQAPGLAEGERDLAIKRMAKEIERIRNTVRQLLDFSRAPAVGAAVGDVREALAHVASLLKPQERLRGVRLSFPTLSEPVLVGIETNALVQVFLNLLLNAGDALAGSGEVRVSVALDAGRVLVRVEDSGPGIPADIARHIFEPFFTTKPAGVGTGLGLAVCERIIAAAGGEISLVDSSLGGAGFRLSLPAPAPRAR